MESIAKRIDRQVEVLERRLSRLRSIRKTIASDPGLAAMLLADEAVGESARRPGRPRVTPSTAKSSVYSRIHKFLSDQNNRPATVPDIATMTGISRGSVANVLYKTHADRFATASCPRHKRAKMWSLKHWTPPQEQQHRTRRAAM